MLLTKCVQEKSFLVIAFLLGSAAPLYGNMFNFLLLGYVLLLFFLNKQEFVKDLKKERTYLMILVLYLFYIVLHTLVVLLKGDPVSKPSYGIFEMLILCFILVPVYVTTLRSWLTPRMLQRFFFYFCIGCLLLNVYILFHLTGKRLFTETGEALRYLYDYRFGDNKKLLGGSLDLEPQALYLALAALISYFMAVVHWLLRMRICYVVLFFVFLFLLSLTVTKGSIFAFLLGFAILNVYLFRRQSWRVRLSMGVCIGLFVCGIVMLGTSQKYHERLEELKVETGDVLQGEYDGGTIGPRVAFWREGVKNFDEYAVWGLGVCAKNRVKEWYIASDANIAQYHNLHNTFLQNWVQGGLLGISLVLFLYFAPVVRMIRRKRFSFLVFAVISVIFVTSNSCTMLSLTNSRTFIMLLFSMFYFYGDTFVRLEDNIRECPRMIKE